MDRRTHSGQVRIRERQRSAGRRGGNPLRGALLALLAAIGGLGVVIIVLQVQGKATEGERYLAEKDRLIAEFRGFEERIRALETRTASELRLAFPDLTSTHRLDAEQRCALRFGEEKQTLLARRRSEQIVLFVPSPDDDLNKIETRLTRLRASEQQWRRLFLEQAGLLRTCLAEVAAEAEQLPRQQEQREHAQRVAQQRQKAMERAEAARLAESVAAPREESRSAIERDAAKVAVEPKPVTRKTLATLRARALSGAADTDDWRELAERVFDEDVPEWVGGLEGVLRAEPASEPGAAAVAALVRALAEDSRKQRLLPWVAAAVRAGSRNDQLLWEAMRMWSAAGSPAESAEVAERMRAAVLDGRPEDVESWLRRVPGRSAFSSDRAAKEWMEDALGQMARELRVGKQVDEEWFGERRDAQITEDFSAAVRQVEHRAMLEAVATWSAVDSQDPVPHLLEAFIKGSLSNSRTRTQDRDRALAKFRRLCKAVTGPRDAASDLPLLVANRLRNLRIDAICREIGVDFATLGSGGKIDCSYAFPLPGNLKSKVQGLERRIERDEEWIDDQERQIRDLQRQRSRVSPNDRKYIDKRVSGKRDAIARREKGIEEKKHEIQRALQAEARTSSYSVQSVR